MKKESLRDLLSRVHERLSHSTSVDSESRKLLVTVMHDIEHALGKGDKPASDTGSRLESLAVRFEVEHPTLADALRRLVDALGKAGI